MLRLAEEARDEAGRIPSGRKRDVLIRKAERARAMAQAAGRLKE